MYDHGSSGGWCTRMFQRTLSAPSPSSLFSFFLAFANKPFPTFYFFSFSLILSLGLAIGHYTSVISFLPLSFNEFPSASTFHFSPLPHVVVADLPFTQFDRRKSSLPDSLHFKVSTPIRSCEASADIMSCKGVDERSHLSSSAPYRSSLATNEEWVRKLVDPIIHASRLYRVVIRLLINMVRLFSSRCS